MPSISNPLLNFANGLDDTLFGGRLKQTICGALLAEYGDVLDFAWDPERRTARIVIMLKGESIPVVVNVDGYEAFTDDQGSWLRIHQATADRDWIDAVLRNLVVGRDLLVPPKIALLLAPLFERNDAAQDQ